ncbi:hypothetical protein D3C74_391790 [compost metagenome]
MACGYIIFIYKQDRIRVSARPGAQHQNFFCLLAISPGCTLLDLRNSVNNRGCRITHHRTGDHVTRRVFAEMLRLGGIVQLLRA